MERIYPEPFRLGCPLFADKFIGRQTLQSLQPAAEVVGVYEVAQVLAQLRVIVVMEAFDGRFFDGPVRPLDLPVGPRMFDLGQAVFDARGYPKFCVNGSNLSGCRWRLCMDRLRLGFVHAAKRCILNAAADTSRRCLHATVAMHPSASPRRLLGRLL